MDNISYTGGWARSPSTLVQLAVGSVPPVDPKFFNIIDGIIDGSVPVPSNQLMPQIVSQVEKFFTGGNQHEDKYYDKYIKYKNKYQQLKNKLHNKNCPDCKHLTGGCGCDI